jgi:hypothetical protein
MMLRQGRFKATRVAAWSCALLLAGCDAWLTKPLLYNTVDVVATQRNGAPIPGVNLILYTGQRPMGYGATGLDGRFTFKRVPEGGYGVYAGLPGGYDILEHFIPGNISFVRDGLLVADDTLVTVHFTFLKVGPGAIVVRVLQLDDAPIAGAQVVAYDASRQSTQATTDAAGTATFSSLAFGAYSIEVIRPVLYRDPGAPGDSLYVVPDTLVVDDHSRDTVAVRFQKF